MAIDVPYLLPTILELGALSLLVVGIHNQRPSCFSQLSQSLKLWIFLLAINAPSCFS